MTAVTPPGTVVIDGPMVPQRHRVVEARRDLPDVVTLAVEPLDGPAPVPRPGQFNMLWTFGGGEVPISVSGVPGDGAPLLHTVRSVGLATAALCACRPGDVIGLRGPFGKAWDLDSARGGDVVVVAGGLGAAPLRPVMRALLADRPAYGEVSVLVGARSPDAVLLADELAEWGRRPDVDVQVTVDHAAAGWTGDVGLVTELLAHAPFDPSVTTAFVCGPEVMMRFVAGELVDRGVEPSRVQVSLERNMKCAVAHCGHCQIGPTLVCRDGAAYPWDVAAPLLAVPGR